MEPINLPPIVAEVAAALERYESALVNNDVAELDQLFWDSPHTVRLGATENLYGVQAIREFRLARPSAGLARTVLRTEITTFGTDWAVAHREYTRQGQPGRQSQTWVRTPDGWKVVSAHVSSLGTSKS
jgi:hypothetical protein